MPYSIHLLRHTRFTIGQNIHRLRAAQRLPLCKLARVSGVPLPKLDQYESGAMKSTSYQFAFKRHAACAPQWR